MELNETYNEIYSNGKEEYHSGNLTLIYSEVYKAIRNHVNGKKILDLGSGDGTFLTNYVTLQEPEEMFGIGFSKEGVNIAQNNIISKERKIRFECKSFESIEDELKFNSCLDKNYFDIITSIGVIEHLDRPELLFYLANKLLKPGGMFIFEHPNFLNIRGLIWKTLEIFLEAEMSLTDKHTILPDFIFSNIEKYNFKCESIKTFHHERGMMSEMVSEDYVKRLPLALKGKIEESKIEGKVKEFFDYLRFITNDKVFTFSPANGSEIIYTLTKK